MKYCENCHPPIKSYDDVNHCNCQDQMIMKQREKEDREIANSRLQEDKEQNSI